MPPMIKLCLILSVVLIGCVPQEEAKFSLPKDEASPDQTAKIKSIVASIETDLEQEGLIKKFDEVPFVVSTLPEGNAARCYKDENDRPLGIVISPTTLVDEFSDPRYVPLSFKAVLHEIGHCYFDREHEEAAFRETSKIMRLVFDAEEGPSEHRLLGLSPTIMEPTDYFQIPIELRRYYVAEVAGLDRVTSWEDFARFGEIELLDAPRLPWETP